jgi:N-acetylneuraminic acid mutarotase
MKPIIFFLFLLGFLFLSRPTRAESPYVCTALTSNTTSTTPTTTIEWTEATDNAAFAPRCCPSVVFQNRLWVIGGGSNIYNNNLRSYSFNDIWWTVDGINWNQVIPNIPFPGICGHTLIAYDNKMWIISGFDVYVDDVVHWNGDVLWTADGIHWNDATPNSSSPLSERGYQTSIVFNNKMWVIAGILNTGGDFNDVWCSSDGATWTQVTAHAAFNPRNQHTSVVYNGKMWVIGGTGADIYNDVWWSSDGTTWTQATACAAFCPRYGHASVVFDNKMWVFGGYYNGINLNDAWWSVG